MLPTCIGISGVSRYRNDASSEDSFLASAMGFLPKIMTRRLDGASCGQTVPAGRVNLSGLCIFRGRIGNGKGPQAIKMTELAFGLRQTVGHGPKGRGINADPEMACEMNLDIFGGS